MFDSSCHNLRVIATTVESSLCVRTVFVKAHSLTSITDPNPWESNEGDGLLSTLCVLRVTIGLQDKEWGREGGSYLRP